MRFIKKENINFNHTMVFRGEYEKPATCPYCGIGTDAVMVDFHNSPYDADKRVYSLTFSCTACQKKFIALYILAGNSLEFNTLVPIMDMKPLHGGLTEISPRFAEIHKQAYSAEARGDFDVAILGYRTALEILIKDYAIAVQGRTWAEVESLGLAKVIEQCVKKDILTAADVIRIIGNDHTHYVNMHPEVDFETFKYYYDIFIRELAVDYDINNPPVSR